MSKNWIAGDVGAGVSLAVTPTGDAVNAKAGDVGPIYPAVGKALIGYFVTPIATSTAAAVGLATGQATVRLAPTEAVVELTVTASAGDPVFVTLDTGTPFAYGTSNGKHSEGVFHIGHAVTIPGRTPGSGNAFVYLGSAGTVAPTAE
jgi:hypothetical protein